MFLLLKNEVSYPNYMWIAYIEIETEAIKNTLPKHTIAFKYHKNEHMYIALNC